MMPSPIRLTHPYRRRAGGANGGAVWLGHAPKTPEALAAPLVMWNEKQAEPPLAAHISNCDVSH